MQMELYNPFRTVSERTTVNKLLRDQSALDAFSPVSLIVICTLTNDQAIHPF